MPRRFPPTAYQRRFEGRWRGDRTGFRQSTEYIMDVIERAAEI
jgi:hypothetical protein